MEGERGRTSRNRTHILSDTFIHSYCTVHRPSPILAILALLAGMLTMAKSDSSSTLRHRGTDAAEPAAAAAPPAADLAPEEEEEAGAASREVAE